jgi:hypothetical protein
MVKTLRDSPASQIGLRATIALESLLRRTFIAMCLQYFQYFLEFLYKGQSSKTLNTKITYSTQSFYGVQKMACIEFLFASDWCRFKITGTR